MAKLLTLLFEVTDLFDMKTRPELILLQKTMVVVEGVARRLNPQLDMWATADPVVREWIERNLGPLGKLGDFGTQTLEAGKSMTLLPSLLNRAETLAGRLNEAAEKGFALLPDSVEAIGRAEARRNRWGNLALWVIAAAVVYIALHGI
jgi:ubiquinone biosynthesis protein